MLDTLTKDLERRLEAAEMWYTRSIIRVSSGMGTGKAKKNLKSRYKATIVGGSAGRSPA